MSYTTITQSTQDQALQDRVTAAAVKEAWSGGPEFVGSDYGELLRAWPQEALRTFIWPVSIEYEEQYAYALGEANPNPGGDEGVITDLNIQASIQVHWPPDIPPNPTQPASTTPGVPVT